LDDAAQPHQLTFSLA